MGLTLSCLQERLFADKNVLLKKHSPDEHQKLAYYSIQKLSVEVAEEPYAYRGKAEPEEFLLQKEVDLKQLQEAVQSQKKEETNQISQIKFKEKQI